MTQLNLNTNTVVPMAALKRQFIPQRILALETAPNVRDLGGYMTLEGLRTRWGLLLRGSRLSGLSPRDYSSLLNYEIRTVVDLRTAAEAFESPDDFAGSPVVRYHRVSLKLGSDFARQDKQPQNLTELNLLWLQYCAAEIKQVFDLLNVPGALPAIFHCTLGKDRTGLLAALLLGALRVPLVSIVDDYMLSSLEVEPLLSHARASATRSAVDPLWLERMFCCRAETMEQTLSEIQIRYGGISAYLFSIGVGDSHLNRLRAELLEPAETIPNGARHAL